MWTRWTSFLKEKVALVLARSQDLCDRTLRRKTLKNRGISCNLLLWCCEMILLIPIIRTQPNAERENIASFRCYAFGRIAKKS